MPTYKSKSRNKWYCQISYVDDYGEYKKKRSKYFDTKREALDEEIKLRAQIKKNSFNNDSPTFEEIYNEFIIRQKEFVKTSTLTAYRSEWKTITFKNVKINKFTVPMYMQFKEYLASKGYSTRYKNLIHSLLTQLLEYAKLVHNVDCDVLIKCGNFKNPNRIREKKLNYYTYEEFKKFIEQIETIKHKSLFTLLYFEGMRIGEANALTWNDIDFDRKLITINKTVYTKIKGIPYLITSTKKTASDRIIPLIDDVEKLLLEQKEEQKKYKNFSEEWFAFGGVRPMGESHLYDVKKRAAEKANLKQIRIHDFRHSAACFYINQLNAQPTMIQALLGHANLSITLNTYHHLFPNQLMGINEMVKQFKLDTNLDTKK